MPNALQAAGAASQPSRYAPIFVNRWWTGLWTQRSPLRDGATEYLVEKFYSGARNESLIGGLNTELSSRLTVVRRPGCSVYNSSTFPAINRFYEFHQFTTGSENIRVIADTGMSGGIIYDATPNVLGGSGQTTIFTKSRGAGSAYFQGVGNTLYFGDGVEVEKYLLVNGAFTTQLWGISMTSGGNTRVTAPTAASQTSNGGIYVSWTNPNNIYATGASYATVTLTENTVSETLTADTLGFSLPAGAVVSGVVISVSASSGTNFLTPTVIATLAGVTGGAQKTATISTVQTTYSFGNNGDLWGAGITAAQVNSSAFGVNFVVVQDAPNPPGTSYSLNTVTVEVYYNIAPTATPHSGSGITTTNGGWNYVYVYGNSVTGHVSSPTSPSGAIGNHTFDYVAVTVVASTDPQVDQIRVFRTVDGGVTFLELPTSPYPNTTTTLHDSASDASLNLLSQAPGATLNNPPPAGLIGLTYHLNCIWGYISNTVYYSSSPLATIGVNVESFPPLNYFVFNSAVTKLIPTASGLVVITDSSTEFIGGLGTSSVTTSTTSTGVTTTTLTPTSPFYPSPFLTQISSILYDAIDVQATDVYFLSTQNQVLDANLAGGVTEIGFPIGDILSNYNVKFVTWHSQNSGDAALYVSDGKTGWYRLNKTPSPETGSMTWSPQAIVTGGCSAVQSIEVLPGQHRLLIGPASSGPILMRDLSVSQDNGTSYPAYATLGSLVLALPGQIAELAFITTDAIACGSHPSTYVMIGEINGRTQWYASTAYPAGQTITDTNGNTLQCTTAGTTGSTAPAFPTTIGGTITDGGTLVWTCIAVFEQLVNGQAYPRPDPPTLPPSKSIYGDRFFFSEGQEPAWCRHLQIRFTWPTENFANELLSFALVGAHHNEIY